MSPQQSRGQRHALGTCSNLQQAQQEQQQQQRRQQQQLEAAASQAARGLGSTDIMAGLLEKVLHKSKSRSPQELVLKTDNSMKKLSLGATDHQVEDVARNLALMKVCSRTNCLLPMHAHEVPCDLLRSFQKRSACMKTCCPLQASPCRQSNHGQNSYQGWRLQRHKLKQRHKLQPSASERFGMTICIHTTCIQHAGCGLARKQ